MQRTTNSNICAISSSSSSFVLILRACELVGYALCIMRILMADARCHTHTQTYQHSPFCFSMNLCFVWYMYSIICHTMPHTGKLCCAALRSSECWIDCVGVCAINRTSAAECVIGARARSTATHLHCSNGVRDALFSLEMCTSCSHTAHNWHTAPRSNRWRERQSTSRCWYALVACDSTIHVAFGVFVLWFHGTFTSSPVNINVFIHFNSVPLSMCTMCVAVWPDSDGIYGDFVDFDETITKERNPKRMPTLPLNYRIP